MQSLGPDLQIYFTYNSHNTKFNFGYGNGWTMNYNVLYEKLTDTIVIHREDARRDTFYLVGGAYHAPVGVFDTLIEYQPGQYLLRSKYGSKQYFEDPLHKRMTKMLDRHWNTLTISYTDGLPATVTDATGRTLQFTFTDGLLTQISDNNTSPIRTLEYGYDGRYNSTSATDLLGQTMHYTYDVNRRMLQLQSRRGQCYDIEYYDYGRVNRIHSELTDLNMDYNFTTDQTTSTNVVGGANQASTFDFDSQGRNTKMTNNCCGYDIDYTYDGDNNINSREDARGFTSNFTADGNGNYLSATDPTGSSLQKSYDPTFNLVTQTIDKLGNITYITRDTSGNAIRIDEPLGKKTYFRYSSTGLLDTLINAKGDTTIYLYNTDGYLVESRHPIGISSFVFDGAGRMIQSTTPENETTHFAYNLNNWLTGITDPLGQITIFNYDEEGNIQKTTNARGFSTIMQYNALQQQIKTTDALGNSTATEYDAMGNVTRITDPVGNETIYEYDSRSLLQTITNAMGNSMYFTYDDNGNVLTETDYNGNVSIMEYDTLNRLKKTTDALGNENQYKYDMNGNLKKITDAKGNQTNFRYDALNQLVKTTYPIGEDSLIYDAVGNMIAYTDPNGHTMNYYYNKMNWLDSIADPMGFVTQYTYNLNGSIVSGTDPNGNSTQYSLDELDRIISMTNAEGELTSYIYNPLGNVETVSYPNGNIVTAMYDALERTIHTYDLIGPISYNYYDQNSRLIKNKDANNHEISYSYDALNRLINIQDAMNNTTGMSYDPNTNLLESTDRNGKITMYAYDELNRQVKAINAMQDTTWTFYDELGNIESLRDAKYNTTGYTYDLMNRLITEIYADGTTKEFIYDDAGNLISRTDNNGDIKNYTYDDNDRLVLRDYPDTNDDSFTYDNAGRMLSATNNNATITYVYDNVNRILSETLNNRVTAYQYDVSNRTQSITYPSGRTIEENTDLRNRMHQIKDGTDILASYQYDPAGRVIRKDYPQNGTYTDYSYNANNRVTRLTHGPNAFIDLAYTFDNEGNRLTVEYLNQPDNSMLAEYDDIYRLVDYKRGQLTGGSISAPTLHQVFNYDELGNRTTMVDNSFTTNYTVNNMNEYSSIANGGIINPVYDNNGNMLADDNHTYKYDNENRIDSVDNGLTAIYSYGPLGRRISKETSVGTSNYYYDGHRVVEEQNESGSLLATFVYGTGIDDLLNMTKAGNEYYYHKNSLGSVLAVSNMNGLPQEFYNYDAFGVVSFFDEEMNIIVNSSIGNDYTFASRKFDVEVGLYHFRARTYNPVYGRFMQRDPLGYFDGMNLYRMVSNNILNKTDPCGLNEGLRAPDWWRPPQDEFNSAMQNWIRNNPLPSKSANVSERENYQRRLIEKAQDVRDQIWTSLSDRERSGWEDLRREWVNMRMREIAERRRAIAEHNRKVKEINMMLFTYHSGEICPDDEIRCGEPPLISDIESMLMFVDIPSKVRTLLKYIRLKGAARLREIAEDKLESYAEGIIQSAITSIVEGNQSSPCDPTTPLLRVQNNYFVSLKTSILVLQNVLYNNYDKIQEVINHQRRSNSDSEPFNRLRIEIDLPEIIAKYGTHALARNPDGTYCRGVIPYKKRQGRYPTKLIIEMVISKEEPWIQEVRFR